ncbi:hypothetical protein M407DRAFT_246706 [Tulasnella calospora MUT 4182]|uniref:Uncharacterized protein n=1 Tax=Tulasnella calospora MUT 4182 TaxID=1051891 RepID=A0A0C3Q3F6_9AGAM|nr:hypothetical protein M407DRAFT_246706 [Tulasnella calospora MUT 4182]
MAVWRVGFALGSPAFPHFASFCRQRSRINPIVADKLALGYCEDTELLVQLTGP